MTCGRRFAADQMFVVVPEVVRFCSRLTQTGEGFRHMDLRGEASITDALDLAIADASPANRYSLARRVADVTRELKDAGWTMEEVIVFIENIASRAPRCADRDFLQAEMIDRATKTYYFLTAS